MEPKKYASIKELVEYGLENVPEDQSITMNLRDFMYVFRTLEEYVRFFHNDDHYPTLEAVKEFLGTVSSGGGFEVLCTAKYKKAAMVKWPDQVDDMFDEGIFSNPVRPKYYELYESEETDKRLEKER